jgi:hypothetical protein
MFNGLFNIEKLDISDNLIRYIDTETFNSMPNLQSLNVCNNSLALIDSSLLASLKNINHLCLANNKIQSIGSRFLNFINDVCLSYFNFNSDGQCVINVTMQTMRMLDDEYQECARFQNTTCVII